MELKAQAVHEKGEIGEHEDAVITCGVEIGEITSDSGVGICSIKHSRSPAEGWANRVEYESSFQNELYSSQIRMLSPPALGLVWGRHLANINCLLKLTSAMMADASPSIVQPETLGDLLVQPHVPFVSDSDGGRCKQEPVGCYRGHSPR